VLDRPLQQVRRAAEHCLDNDAGIAAVRPRRLDQSERRVDRLRFLHIHTQVVVILRGRGAERDERLPRERFAGAQAEL